MAVGFKKDEIQVEEARPSIPGKKNYRQEAWEMNSGWELNFGWEMNSLDIVVDVHAKDQLLAY